MEVAFSMREGKGGEDSGVKVLQFRLTRSSNGGRKQLEAWTGGNFEGVVQKFHLYTTIRPWKLVRLTRRRNTQEVDSANASYIGTPEDRQILATLEVMSREANVVGLEGIAGFLSKFKTLRRQDSRRFSLATRPRSSARFRRSGSFVDRKRSGHLGFTSLSNLPPPDYLAPPPPPPGNRNSAKNGTPEKEDEKHISHIMATTKMTSFATNQRKSSLTDWVVLSQRNESSASSLAKDIMAHSPRNLKLSIRNGLPSLVRKDIWMFSVKNLKPGELNVEALEDEMDSEEEILWHGHVPETEKEFHAHVPDFGGRTLLHSHPLTRDGEIVVKRLLCLLQATFPHVTYCPSLPDLTAILALHMDDWQAFLLLKTIIQKSDKREEFYLPLSGERFMCHVESLQTLLEARCRIVADCVKKIGFDIIEIFEVWFARLFVGFLKYDTVLRIVDVYLSEGCKVLFRLSLAVLMLHQKSLCTCSSEREFKQRLAELMITRTPADDLFRTAFGLPSFSKKMLQNLHARHKITEIPFAKVPVFYTPSFDSKMSDLLTISSIRLLWKHLDPVHGIQDPVCMYSGKKDGYSMDTLHDTIMRRFDSSEMLCFLVIKTSDQVILGCLMHLLKHEKQASKKGDTVDAGYQIRLGRHTFLFQLHPRANIFRLKREPELVRNVSADDHDLRRFPKVHRRHQRSSSQPDFVGVDDTKLYLSNHGDDSNDKQVDHSTLLWIHFTKEILSFGAPDETILSLDDKLHNGFSEACSLFGSPPLPNIVSDGKRRKDFRAVAVELWGLTR